MPRSSFILIATIAFHPANNVFAATYHVSPTGSDTNPGSLAQPWLTLTHASAECAPGDTLFVKSGSYNEEVEFTTSGTAGDPIVFIGYMNFPGDAPPVLVNAPDPYAAFLPGDMPTFDGGDRANGVGFDLRDTEHLVLRNFQIRNYAYGLIAGASGSPMGHIALENVNVMSIGNVSASYSGYGILFGSMGTRFSDNNTVTDCLVVNSASEGISVNGDHNTVSGCMVYCNEDVANASMDYYVIVTGSYNTFTDCHIERLPDLSHNGHGFTAKTNAEQVVDDGLPYPAIAAEYNEFRNCTAVNLGESFCVRHRTARYNLFAHCTAYGTHTGANGSSSGEGNCVVIRDGASDNTFDGCVAQDCSSAIRFLDTVEDGDTGPNPPGHPGNGNRIINSVFVNCYTGVNFNDYSIPSDAGDNLIAHCTFHRVRYMHYAARSCQNMKYVGNIYHGTLPATPGGYFKGNAYAADIVPNGANTWFKDCDFINIQGGMPTNFVANAVGSIAADPLFMDPANNDLHLQVGSPCIDAVATSTAVLFDMDSLARPLGSAPDMGAYEFLSGMSVGAANVGGASVGVYPNPASSTMCITGVQETDRITLHDMRGVEVLSRRATGGVTELQVQGIASGVYQVRVVGEGRARMAVVVIHNKAE